MNKFVLIGFLFLIPTLISGQELVPDTVEVLKARVVNVLSQEVQQIPGTDTEAIYQDIEALLLSGSNQGSTVRIENDFLELDEGDVFYVTHTTNTVDGIDYYAVGEPYRMPVLLALLGLFLFCVVVFGGKQGIRGVISLSLSLACVIWVLFPLLMAGYPPVAVSLGVVSVLVIIGSYITHGISRMTTAAVAGMVMAIGFTGLLAYLTVAMGNISGFTGEEVTYLHINARGTLDLSGLLIGGILIGLLGVLYDAAIGQSVAVEELLRAKKKEDRREVFIRALRMGREHIGALVNTLAIAYVAASLPLLLYFYGSTPVGVIPLINSEMFAAEIIRILVSSIGVILVVPLTTLIATYLLEEPREGVSITDTHVH